MVSKHGFVDADVSTNSRSAMASGCAHVWFKAWTKFVSAKDMVLVRNMRDQMIVWWRMDNLSFDNGFV